MSDLAENLSRNLLAKDRRSEGLLVDLNTGTIRPDHVLVQRTPGADLFIGFGSAAGRLLDFAFEGEAKADPFLATCASADRALQDGDLTKAQQLSLHDTLARIGDPHLRRLALAEMMIGKASVDDPVRPGWAPGTPGGLGGKFRPKDNSAATRETAEQEIKRLAARTAFKMAAAAALKLAVTAVLNFIPGEGVIADVAELVELAHTAIQLGNLAQDVNAALDFVKRGPYALDDLRMSPEYEEFSSMRAFEKISPALAALLKAFGSAGSGSEYHHIVEQGGDNEENIPAEQLHSTKNVIPLPRMLHELVSAEYSKRYGETGMTVRQWLRTQPFDVQWKYGIDTLRRLAIVK